MKLRDRILARLEEVHFRTGEGSLSPFGQTLPLVVGWAVDDATASFALIVEDPNGVVDEDPWRELLFALSGIRHELRDGSAAALGTPVVIALLEQEEHAQRLRSLVEQMSAQYVLFSRVELNVVVAEAAEPDVNRALAPLLPNCRRAVMSGTVVGREALYTLAEELRAAVTDLAYGLEAPLSGRADAVAGHYAEQLAQLVIGDGGDAAFSPTAWAAVRLDDFRSFKEKDIQLGTLTLVEGLNGTGKSSLVEALELLWAGTSQRKPPDETTDSYDEHLGRDGRFQWRVSGLQTLADSEPLVISKTQAVAPGALARNVFSQDGSADIARETKKVRYAELLRLTGLAIPELQAECARLNRAAKADLDLVLERLGMSPLTTIRARAIEHVQSGLARLSATALPSFDAVREAEMALAAEAAASGLTYQVIPRVDKPAEESEKLARSASQLSGGLRTDAEFVNRVRRLHEELRALGEDIEKRARGLDALIAAISVRDGTRPERQLPNEPALTPVIPPAVAGRWLRAGRSLEEAARDLQAAAESVSDPTWRQRLVEFTESAEGAVARVPFDELENMAETPLPKATPESKDRSALDRIVLDSAGFTSEEVVEVPAALIEPAVSLGRALHSYASQLASYRANLLDGPLMRLQGVEDDLVDALTKFELAKRLKVPLEKTQDDLISRLISGPLEPLLVELIAALTRFEWYFHPFKIAVKSGSVEMTGLATPSERLDVRMLLNTGERAIVTTAWFLALHLLQPATERKVLVLDDPFSSLDENNQAALIATLRAVARLTKPELLMVCSHDRTIVDAVEREFAAMDEWPTAVARLRFSRAPDGTSSVDGHPVESPRADYERELQRLGLGDSTSLAMSDTGFS